MGRFIDLYALLGVPSNASRDAILNAYEERVAELDASGLSTEEKAGRLAWLEYASAILKDEQRRMAYDFDGTGGYWEESAQTQARPTDDDKREEVTDIEPELHTEAFHQIPSPEEEPHDSSNKAGALSPAIEEPWNRADEETAGSSVDKPENAGKKRIGVLWLKCIAACGLVLSIHWFQNGDLFKGPSPVPMPYFGPLLVSGWLLCFFSLSAITRFALVKHAYSWNNIIRVTALFVLFGFASSVLVPMGSLYFLAFISLIFGNLFSPAPPEVQAKIVLLTAGLTLLLFYMHASILFFAGDGQERPTIDSQDDSPRKASRRRMILAGLAIWLAGVIFKPIAPILSPRSGIFGSMYLRMEIFDWSRWFAVFCFLTMLIRFAFLRHPVRNLLYSTLLFAVPLLAASLISPWSSLAFSAQLLVRFLSGDTAAAPSIHSLPNLALAALLLYLHTKVLRWET